MYMTNKNIVWAIVAVVVLLGIWYVYSMSSGGSAWSPVATTTEQTAGQNTGGTTSESVPAKTVGNGSITQLFGLKEPLVCSITTKTANLNRSGTVYVAGGEMRGDFTSVINGVSIETSMIDDGAALYVWKNGATKGLKLPASVGASGGAIQNYGGLDLATAFSYSCSVWTGNFAGTFTPPTSVVFSSTP